MDHVKYKKITTEGRMHAGSIGMSHTKSSTEQNMPSGKMENAEMRTKVTYRLISSHKIELTQTTFFSKALNYQSVEGSIQYKKYSIETMNAPPYLPGSRQHKNEEFKNKYYNEIYKFRVHI